ncbi:MAG: TIGR01777 family oxidoreductase, partial [Chitinophagaceae bacterium]
MKRKIIIAGGTGFIGTYLANGFKNLGDTVIIISRKNRDIHWEQSTEIKSALENSDILINLAGKSVDCRYTEKNKKEIMLSRTETTKALGEAAQKCKVPPKLWINSSTATIYRHAEDREMNEESGEIGTGFSVEVAKNWEYSFFSFDLPKTRQVALRMAIVLGKGGGVIKPFMNLVRFGLGGRQGNGKQMFSWLHIEDLFQIILFLEEKQELTGIF